MAAQTALVLNTKSYAPRGKSGEIARWALVGDTTFGGAMSNLTQRLVGPNSNGDYILTVKLAVPKAATESSACACIGAEVAKEEFNLTVKLPSTYTVSERDDAVKRFQGYIASAVFTAAAKDLEPAW